MYGTVARCRVKPGMGAQFIDYSRRYETAKVPGLVALHLYRMDTNSNEYYLAVVFESKELYLANAASPEQNARYTQMMELLVSDPEWHDGEVVYTQR